MLSQYSRSTILIAAGALAWLILALGSLMRIPPKFRGPGLDVVAIFVAAAALVASVAVPERLDHDNNARQAKSTCYTAVIATRKALNVMVQGYTVAPEARDQRRADWESLRIELQNTYFGCQDANLSNTTRSEMSSLIDNFDAAKKASDRPDPDAGYLDRVTTWTIASLQQLQKP